MVAGTETDPAAGVDPAMDPAGDGRLRRLFAQAPVSGPDEAFVAAVAAGVRARRRRWRYLAAGGGAVLVAAGLALAVLLAPFAPPVAAPVVAPSPELLLQLPDRLADLAAAAARPLNDPVFDLVLAACLLPFAGVAWLLRRG